MTALLSSITQEDLETLRAINSSFKGGSFFSEEDEEAIEPVIHTQGLLDEWTRRDDVRAIDDLWKIAWAGERTSFMWMHEGVCLSLTTCGMTPNPGGSVRLETCDLMITAHRVEYRLPPTGRLVFLMYDLRIPQELLDHLEEIIT